MSEDKLMKWVYYLMNRCAFSGKYCSRKECPMEDYNACIQARDQLKEIVEGRFREQGLPEKRALTIEEVIQNYPEQMKKILQQKPVVTELQARILFSSDTLGEFLGRLKELGVTVEEKE